jgi:3-phosphoglycerate kinase
MINLPKITDLDLKGKRVLLRLDLDLKEFDENDLRLTSSNKTLDYLKENNCQITIIAHRGRPDGVDEKYSLKIFQPYFDKWNAKLEENLRFDKGEETNDPEFAKKIALLGEVYINEAFASSHRSHASIVGIPKLLQTAFGFRFTEEVEILSKEFDKPVYGIISGIKEDKKEMAVKLSTVFDKVLVGGRLPEYFGDDGMESVRLQDSSKRLLIGNLLQDKEDITLNTIERFKEEISKAKTIVLAGALGKYEDEGHSQGTKEIFEFISKTNCFKIAGGGDTESCLKKYNLTDKFDWVSVGGGAMLYFLVNKTLPAIKALQ